MLTEEERVERDSYGAQVVELRDGLFEVWCASHATQLISPHQEYLERRAAAHNKNWHPKLTTNISDENADG